MPRIWILEEFADRQHVTLVPSVTCCYIRFTYAWDWAFDGLVIQCYKMETPVQCGSLLQTHFDHVSLLRAFSFNLIRTTTRKSLALLPDLRMSTGIYSCVGFFTYLITGVLCILLSMCLLNALIHLLMWSCISFISYMSCIYTLIYFGIYLFIQFFLH